MGSREPAKTRIRSETSKASSQYQKGEGDVIRMLYTGELFSINEEHPGGMGKVYIGKREAEGTDYALKTILLERAATDEAKEALFKRFDWESQVWILLGKHKNIVQAHWFDQDQLYRPLLIMEYVAGDPRYGVTLRDWLKKYSKEGKKPSLQFILKLGIEVLTGLLYAQRIVKEELAMDFVHRDLKPENILMTKDGIAKVTDFGLVKAFGEVGKEILLKAGEGEEERITFMVTKGVCGTPPYMAPEQWQGEEPNEKTDIYALGCVLYEMFTGKQPFWGPFWDREQYKDAHLHTIPHPLQRGDDDIPDVLKDLVVQCLAKDTAERPGLAELRDNLQEIYEGLYSERVVVEDGGEELTAWEWSARGLGFHRLLLFRKAVSCFDQAIALDPMDARAYNNRGNVYNHLGQLNRAIENYDRAIELNLGYYFAYNGRGNAYSDLGRHERAIKDYDQAIELDPRYPLAYNSRGDAYSKLGRHERAIEDYDQAIELHPRYSEAYMNRGLAYYHLGQYERAIADNDRAIALEPKFAQAYNHRGLAYNALDQYECAIKDFDQAIALGMKSFKLYAQKYLTIVQKNSILLLVFSPFILLIGGIVSILRKIKRFRKGKETNDRKNYK